MNKQNENNISENTNKEQPIPAVQSKIKRNRENIEIMGFKIPIFALSLFVLVLGFGGYITPILLIAGILLLAKVDNKKLTSNFLVVLVLYASQFIIETGLTFVASIPTSFVEWLSRLVSHTGTLEILANISKGCTNVFSVISGFVSAVFFIFYILSVISLFKTDKIKIPVVTEIIQKFIK